MKRVLLTAMLVLLSGATQAQQTVTLSGNVTVPASTVSYNQVITLVGLPSGCVASIAATTITITGCPTSLPVGVTVTCSPTKVSTNSTVTCSAAVTNAANLGVTWSSSAGLISTSGVLTVPATPGTITVTAQSLQDTTKSGSAVITVVTPALPMTVQSESASSSSGPINIQPTSDAGGGSKVVTQTVSQTYDYTITVATAGNYIIAMRMCNFPNATGATTVHFEHPNGTDVSGPLSLLNGAQWTTIQAASGRTVNLLAGSQTIRMVVDALATGGTTSPGGQFNWFSLTPSGNPPPTVKLLWNPSTSASILGYNIYRGTLVGGPYVKINNALIPAAPYVDTDVLPQSFYTYVATSVGDATIYQPAESVYSNEASGTTP